MLFNQCTHWNKPIVGGPSLIANTDGKTNSTKKAGRSTMDRPASIESRFACEKV
jgi:hypothetical protein